MTAAGLLAARVARRGGDVDAELAWLERALAESPADARVHLALAKCLEHRAKDLPRAVTHARHTVPAEDEDQRARRVARLERRLATREG